MGEIYDLTEMGLEEGQEPYAVEGGKEYELRIIDIRTDKDKNDMKYIMPRLEVVDEPYSKDFTHFLYIPDKKTMDPKQLNKARFAMGNFLMCFGADMGGRMNFKDQMVGATGWALLGKKDDEEYGEQNFVKKFITAR